MISRFVTKNSQQFSQKYQVILAKHKRHLIDDRCDLSLIIHFFSLKAVLFEMKVLVLLNSAVKHSIWNLKNILISLQSKKSVWEQPSHYVTSGLVNGEACPRIDNRWGYTPKSHKTQANFQFILLHPAIKNRAHLLCFCFV